MQVHMNKPKLLIAEDESQLLELLVEELVATGIDVHTAPNGQVALAMALEHNKSPQPFHAILSDINMPKMSGLELLKEVRRAGFETPFVILTAYGDKEKTVLALQMGAYDFVDKPYDIQKLNKTVSDALNLGIAQLDIERELDELCAKHKIPHDQQAQFKQARRNLLQMKIERQQVIKKIG